MRSFLVALALLCSLGTAWADDPLAKPTSAAAREHLAQGNKLYRLRELDEAIAEYKAGALVEDAPVFLYNLGQCYRQSGQYEDAIWHYERFLDRGKPTGALRDAVDGFLAQMKAERDKRAMTLPPTEPAPVPPPVAAPAPPPRRAPVEEGEAWYRDGMGWALAGTGFVAGVVGGGLVVHAQRLDNDANRQPTESARRTEHDQAHSRRIAGALTGIGGAALLAVGIVKLVLHPDEHSDEQAWNLGVTGQGLMVFGRF